jgi:predicted transposase YbfD/YdcC
VEANQSTLLGEIRRAFAENASPALVGKDHAHGRFETRRARTLTHHKVINTLSVTGRLRNIRAICWIQRTRVTQEGIETTDQFHISSRPLGPRDYMTINRSHWSIEAMHHVLDVSLAEDQSRIAKAAAIAGAMRRHAYAIIDGIRGKFSFKRCAAKLRANPEPILGLL